MIIAQRFLFGDLTHVLQHRKDVTFCPHCRDRLKRMRRFSYVRREWTHYFQHMSNPDCIGLLQPARLGCRTTIR
jgi:hypothetical protein